MALVCAATSLLPWAGAPAGADACSEDLFCGFLECRAGAKGPPSALWSNLAPIDTSFLPTDRDSTDCQDIQGCYGPYWMEIDIEGTATANDTWLFAAVNNGFQIWSLANPAAPVRSASLGRSNFPIWPSDPHESSPVRTVAAPPGNPSVAAVGMGGAGGLVVFNTVNKTQPPARYADAAKTVLQVHAARIGAAEYAFAATTDAGLLAYNLTAAAARTTLCQEQTPGQTGCGVYVGRLSTRSYSFLAGVGNAAGTSHWLAASSGASAFGVELWNVSNPASPSQLFTALTNEFVLGVALWRQNGGYFLATRVIPLSGSSTYARIYDLSCLGTGTCTGLGAPIWSREMPGGESFNWVTASESGGKPYLHFGTINKCSQGAQNEWLFDVSTPSAPQDLTTVNGVPTGYWGWYYRRNSTGFNQVAPRMGLFRGDYFYRAGYSILDLHRLQVPAAPTIAGVTASTSAASVCDTVLFTAESAVGNPTPTLAWEVRDAANQAIASGGNVNPFGWNPDNATPVGNYTGRVTATNVLGSASASSPAVAIAPPPALAFTGPGGAPTHDAFLGPTVQFHVATAGASGWCWDFDDGISFPTGCLANIALYSTDPVAGANPIHTYTATGTYSARAWILNCFETNPLISNPDLVVVASLAELAVVDFDAQGCSFGLCIFEQGREITFTVTATGPPDFYDYDWDGDGSYEMVATAPVTSHSYSTIIAAPGVFPALRVRRATEQVTATQNPGLLISANSGPGSLPADPTSLQATAPSSTSIQLQWTDNANNETSYEVEQTRDGIYQGITSHAANTVTLDLGGLTSLVPYSFRVRARNGAGSSAWSNVAGATPPDPGLIATGDFESGELPAGWPVGLE